MPQDKKASIVAEWQRARARGATQAAFCASKKINPRTLRSWVSQVASPDSNVHPGCVRGVRDAIDRLERVARALEVSEMTKGPLPPAEIHLYLDDEMATFLDDVAERVGSNRSSVVRDLLTKYMAGKISWSRGNS